MKKLFLLLALICGIAWNASAQVSKPDAVLSPNGPNTSVYWNVKFKTMIIPHYLLSGRPASQDTIGQFFLNTDPSDKHIYVKTSDGYVAVAMLSDVIAPANAVLKADSSSFPGYATNWALLDSLVKRNLYFSGFAYKGNGSFANRIAPNTDTIRQGKFYVFDATTGYSGVDTNRYFPSWLHGNFTVHPGIYKLNFDSLNVVNGGDTIKLKRDVLTISNGTNRTTISGDRFKMATNTKDALFRLSVSNTLDTLSGVPIQISNKLILPNLAAGTGGDSTLVIHNDTIRKVASTGTYAFVNGITNSAGNVGLGGTLTNTTNIDNVSHPLIIAPGSGSGFQSKEYFRPNSFQIKGLNAASPTLMTYLSMVSSLMEFRVKDTINNISAGLIINGTPSANTVTVATQGFGGYQAITLDGSKNGILMSDANGFAPAVDSAYFVKALSESCQYCLLPKIAADDLYVHTVTGGYVPLTLSMPTTLNGKGNSFAFIMENGSGGARNTTIIDSTFVNFQVTGNLGNGSSFAGDSTGFVLAHFKTDGNLWGAFSTTNGMKLVHQSPLSNVQGINWGDNSLSGYLEVQDDSLQTGFVNRSDYSGNIKLNNLALTPWGMVKTKLDSLNSAIIARSYLTTISGISSGGDLSGTYPNPTVLNSAVTGKVLTGYTSGAGTVSSSDNILQAFQKINGNEVADAANIASNTTAIGTKVSTSTTVAGFALSSNVTLAGLTATDGTLTFSGSYNGSTARTIGLNLGNANSWTAPQTITSTTGPQFSVDYDATHLFSVTVNSSGAVSFGATAGITLGSTTINNLTVSTMAKMNFATASTMIGLDASKNIVSKTAGTDYLAPAGTSVASISMAGTASSTPIKGFSLIGSDAATTGVVSLAPDMYTQGNYFSSTSHTIALVSRFVPTTSGGWNENDYTSTDGATPTATGFSRSNLGSITATITNTSTGGTSVGGSTSGTALFKMPEQGTAVKRVIIYCNALNGTASFTYPTAFTNTPVVVSTSGLATSKVTSVSTTACTVTGTTDTGYLIIEGF